MYLESVSASIVIPMEFWQLLAWFVTLVTGCAVSKGSTYPHFPKYTPHKIFHNTKSRQLQKWSCHKNGLIKTSQKTRQNLHGLSPSYQNLYWALGLSRLILVPSKGLVSAQPIWIVGCRWNRLEETVFVAAPFFRLTTILHFEKFYTPWIQSYPVRSFSPCETARPIFR